MTTPDGTSPITPFGQYSYTPLVPPTLVSISPDSGPESGGIAVNILGTGFVTNNTMVFFGNSQALSVVVHSFNMLTAIAPPGIGVVDITIFTSMGQSPITPSDRFTYTPSPFPPLPYMPLPPSDFKGIIKKNKLLNKTDYILISKWQPSPTPNVVFYRIYQNGNVIQTIPAGSPLVFEKCLNSRNSASAMEISAVNSFNIESFKIKLGVKND